MDVPVRDKGVYKFGLFRLDPTRRLLSRDGQPISLTPTVFDVLVILVENAGRVVPKEELLDAVWPGRVVEESNIKQAVFTLRRALAPEGDRMIVTAPGRGYRFAEPVSREPSPAPAPVPPPASTVRRLRLGRRAVWTGAGGLALLLLAVGIGVWRWRAAPPVQGGRTVVLADFANQTRDPIFDRTLGSVLRIDLSQSPYIDVLSDRQAQDTLALMTRPRDTPLTPALAEEVCTRNNGDAVLAGALAPLGSRYLLTLTASACADGRLLAGEKTEAANREAVVGALDGLIDGMRRRLGESIGSIRRFDVPLARQRTGSLEALKAYSEAVWLFNHGHLTEAIPFDQRAVALDPGFAAAYASLGVIYPTLFDARSGADYLRKAYALRDTLNEREKFHVASLYDQFVLKDYDKTIRNLEAWTSVYTLDATAWSNLANAEDYIGRHEAAVADGKRAVALNPSFETPYVVLARAELRAGRLDQAVATAALAVKKGLASDGTHRELLRIALARHDDAGVQRELAWAHAQPAARGTLVVEGEMTFARGEVRAGEAMFDHVADLLARQGAGDYTRLERASILAAFGATDQARALLAGPVDETDPNYLLTLAEVGDAGRAETLIDKAVAESPTDTLLTRVFAPQVRAALALRRGRGAEAVADLAPALPYRARDLDTPYLLGTAQLAAGDGRGAAATFQEMLDHQCWYPESALYPLARLGLARALRLQHDVSGARRSYEAFFTLWRHADPDIPILRAAQAEYARL